jgi:acetate kinase
MLVLVLNPGSSSLKSSVVETAELEAPTPREAGGEPSGGGEPSTGGRPPAPLASMNLDWGVDATAQTDQSDDIRSLLSRYEESGIATASLGAIGYRVVHGGTRFREPVLITPDVVAAVDELRSLAPLHNGIAVATMNAGLKAAPQLPQVAVFDTAFHAMLPEDAFRYPVPERWYREWGVRRYGFHGMSVAWSAERAAAMLAAPEPAAPGATAPDLGLVAAHLGSGCSVTAVHRGRSVATSMGLTPLEGLMMGTRSGSIDPGILFALARDGRLSVDEMAEELDHASGLVGVSGRTSDVRDLLGLEASGDEAATLALAIFVRRAAECIAAAATSLPRLDGIVFTGGIGENAGALRRRIVGRLGLLGVPPIGDESPAQDAILTAPGARPAVLRIEAREDLIVARAAARLVATGR